MLSITLTSPKPTLKTEETFYNIWKTFTFDFGLNPVQEDTHSGKHTWLPWLAAASSPADNAIENKGTFFMLTH